MSLTLSFEILRRVNLVLIFQTTITVTAFSVPFSVFAAEKTVVDAQVSVLHLINGDYVTGTLVGSPDQNTLGWQSPAFLSPLQFPIHAVSSIHFSPPKVLPAPQGTYGFELADGDLIYGSIIQLDKDIAVIDAPGFGRLNIDRSIVMRMFRRGAGSDQLYVGPTGLNGWQTAGEANAWREDAGQLFTDRPNAILKRDLGLPNRVRLEFEISWTSKPDFEFAIGVGDNPDTVARAFKFEVWEGPIVVNRQTDKDADLFPLETTAGPKGGRLHVQAFIDQTEGRILVLSSNGEQLGEMTVKSAKPSVMSSIQLTNRKGDIRLERLQVGRWNGESPQKLDLEKSRIHAVDGTITYTVLNSYDSEKHEFVVGDEADRHSIPEDTVQDLFFSQSAPKTPRALRAVYLSGTKISGDLVRVEDQNLWLKPPGIKEEIAVPFAELQSVVTLKPRADLPELPQRKGRLEINGLTLNGCVVDGNSHETSNLNWQPLHCTTPVPIQKGVPGRIVYREPPPKPTPEEQQQQAGAMNAPVRVIRSRTTSTRERPRKASKPAESVLHLRTGDTIPCESVRIDEEGIHFKSANSEATFVPNSRVQALELNPNIGRGNIDPTKKSRLLTVPRMQRTNPPTHLIRSLDGDYLRGRLVSMDEEQIQVELRLEAKIVRRDSVARILWLHPEILDSSLKKPTNEKEGFELTNLVQALSSDGNRLTFLPDQVTGTTLVGKSELLGTWRIDLQTVDQLIMGTAIDLATSDLPFQWRLKKAADPLAPKEDDGSSSEGREGQEAALVGKQAPEIALNQLDGTAFQLSSHKGKVVILDFWASWCGPCLQAMPQIDKVAHEFADQGVELFAVNLEETPEKVKSALERLKLSPTVILDRDGRIAEKYGATSIPQTVIIDRDGRVARLFVGGGARFDEQLAAALKAVLAADNPKTDQKTE